MCSVVFNNVYCVVDSAFLSVIPVVTRLTVALPSPTHRAALQQQLFLGPALPYPLHSSCHVQLLSMENVLNVTKISSFILLFIARW